MKALALLTTVFLPGTFLAVSFPAFSGTHDSSCTQADQFWQTMFALPMIDWSTLELPVGSFSLYWIVTVLLTIVVLSVWAGWMRLNERRHKARLGDSSKMA
jgi:hypothetical protein